MTWLSLTTRFSIGKSISIHVLANRLQKSSSVELSHLPLFFNNIQVSQSSSQNDEQLTFCEHLKRLTSKINKTIALLRKLQNLLPRSALITIYKAFVKSHLDYGDIIYDEAYNASFHHKLELFQYNVFLALTGGISKEKLYQELGLESLQLQRWFRKLCSFLQDQPSYFSNIVPQRKSPFNTRNIIKVP